MALNRQKGNGNWHNFGKKANDVCKAVRMEDVFYEKLELKKDGGRQNNLEFLGQAMQDASNEFGETTPYGIALNKVAQTEFKIGGAEREFISNSANNTLLPIRRFLEGDMKTIQKERKILQGKRLDLDACKSRLKKAKTLETQAVAEADLRKEYKRHIIIN
uniref:BAR domain-containing protein n=1 Tax=Panagrolaimus superbus TaxID=310955 RepID=A0A914YVI3_9BILA